jgi:D-3-phosphoglycerate dehydrogenase
MVLWEIHNYSRNHSGNSIIRKAYSHTLGVICAYRCLLLIFKMGGKRVLITDDCHPYLTERLTALGYSCDFFPEISLEKTLETIQDYTGLIINSKILVNRQFLDKAVQLRFIGRLGSGMEIVDRVYAAEKGVAVFSSPEGNRNAVAEQALGMLLALANNLCRADREVRQEIWRREANRGWELKDKVIGIIGFGHTGSSFASKLSGMGMTVLAFDKYLPYGYADIMPWVKMVQSLEEIQVQADIISLHLPLTAATRHLVNQDFIEHCRKGFVLMNTSRGACIDTKAVADGLDSGQIGGACLDVFENEKPPTFSPAEKEVYNRLYLKENAIFAPHIAGWTHESKRKMAEILAKRIENVTNLINH